MRAEIVALNIGGRVYETTKETLRRSAYFEPFLEGRFAHAVDSHGRLFVDRDGKHFAHLLAFMRTLQCPPLQPGALGVPSGCGACGDRLHVCARQGCHKLAQVSISSSIIACSDMGCLTGVSKDQAL